MLNTIKIGLVEDQFLFREGMKAIVKNWPMFKLVFESPDGHSVIAKLDNSKILPDVMLVDQSLPALEKVVYNGLEVTRALVEKFPKIKILILSAYEDEIFISLMIENGAHGYLTKDCNPKEVAEAIISVYNKGSYINERTLSALHHNTIQKDIQKKVNIKLSKREEEILQLVCQQMTASEIGEKLFISTKTVNGHRTNLLEKTGSRNVTGLVLYAVKNKLVIEP